jgi:hypothetical protein
MDDSHFDTLTRSLTATRSRRGALATLLGGPPRRRGCQEAEEEENEEAPSDAVCTSIGWALYPRLRRQSVW